ncbi:MAG: hypothetical protein CL858_11925 [Cupriavidus sp.]|jgi:hypothetical protein|uniref:YXWGXW repeat-containing protein n=1 Tax=Cupriavidus pauculus TaxID=82633 RepID=UPI00078264A8|nr:YXWGXW repeat-containing protein [Cupriavidus pauculus]MBU66148.1 hypothetical protein [Cupriavidus sp.]KAB0600637.1 hypothetical protein F7R19_20160 [Cupriavidus pauculus]MBY4733129.1 YXWGXW repeat-containing protein [Cupriavidus pauculus]MCM3607581.1 YXWGXW repeat-containing protein [Cupriavidus pauculus]UAL01748.1 YXWGXW repeat-containing protein [Cupriavidus pauculus]
MKRQLLLAAAVLATGGVFGLLSPAQAHGYYDNPPPPPRHEARPAPRPGQVWVPGHYDRAHDKYAWRSGYYQSARPGHHYVPGRWVHGPHGWYQRPGYWGR